MPLFNQKPKASPEVPITTLIGPDTFFKGEVRGRGALRVSGEIEGIIETEGDIYIAEGSTVRGNLQGKHVVVSGTVQGNIKATESLEITPEGKVIGDITGETLSIHEGAVFRGRVNVEAEEEEGAPCISPVTESTMPSADVLSS